MEPAIKRTIVALAACACLTAQALGQGMPVATGATPLSEQELAALDVRAGMLRNKDVMDATGNKLGKIEDLVIDVANSRLHYVVLSVGGFLGVGDKLVAIPANQLRLTGAYKTLTLNASRRQLEQAPGFKSGSWPDWNSSYRTQVDKMFLRKDELLQLPDRSRLTRASQVLGKDVEDRGSHTVGDIADLVVNLGNRQIRYAILAVAGKGTSAGKLVAMPLNAFLFPRRPDIPIYLEIDPKRIEMARAFDKNQWPDLNAAGYRKDLESYFSRLTRRDRQQASGTGSAPAQNTSGASGNPDAAGSAHSAGSTP